MLKKFFILKVFLFLALLINFSTCNAANFVRVADDGAESFHARIVQWLSIADGQQKKFVIGNLFRAANADIPEQNLNAWACQFGVKNSSAPDGEILFNVNSQGYVQTLKVISYSDKNVDSSSTVFAITMLAAGLTPDEIKTLMKTAEGEERFKMSAIWSSLKKRKFLMNWTPRATSEDGFQFLVMAFDS